MIGQNNRGENHEKRERRRDYKITGPLTTDHRLLTTCCPLRFLRFLGVKKTLTEANEVCLQSLRSFLVYFVPLNVYFMVFCEDFLCSRKMPIISVIRVIRGQIFGCGASRTGSFVVSVKTIFARTGMAQSQPELRRSDLSPPDPPGECSGFAESTARRWFPQCAGVRLRESNRIPPV